MDVNEKHAVRFFDNQFRRQVESGDFALNPFEQLALPHVHGEVLDLGCGLGNLSLAAARQGCRVHALDGSSAAIARLQAAALDEGLPVEASVADLEHWAGGRIYDTTIAIGLLMFFPRQRALGLLKTLCGSVKSGGCCIVNVLTTGTTYMEMFEAGRYHLFSPVELETVFGGWKVRVNEHTGFDAPGATRKEFVTIVAERPGIPS